jgi:hypothetical protein
MSTLKASAREAAVSLAVASYRKLQQQQQQYQQQELRQMHSASSHAGKLQSCIKALFTQQHTA